MEKNDMSLIISNFLSFKKMLDTLEEEVHSGEYNVKVLKKISKLAEKFYLNMENEESDEDEPSEKQFFPKVYEIENSSDSDDEFSIRKLCVKKQDDKDESNFVDDEQDFDKKFKEFIISTQNAEKKEILKEDKLFDDFLNNDISMKKYNYLKHNVNNNVEKFCTLCYSY